MARFLRRTKAGRKHAALHITKCFQINDFATHENALNLWEIKLCCQAILMLMLQSSKTLISFQRIAAILPESGVMTVMNGDVQSLRKVRFRDPIRRNVGGVSA